MLQTLLALAGLFAFVAGYSIPASYERLYFYNVYRLDFMTGGNIIASTCGSPCNLNDFIRYITKEKITLPSIPETDIIATAEKIAEQKLTGPVDFGRVFRGIKSREFSALLEKIGEHAVGRMGIDPESKYESLPAKIKEVYKSEELYTEAFGKIKTNIFTAARAVYDARVDAAISTFKPLPDFEPVMVGKKINFAKSAAKYPGQTSKEALKTLWESHIRGGHQENIKKLVDTLTKMNDLGCELGRKRHVRRSMCDLEDADFFTSGGEVVAVPELSEAHLERESGNFAEKEFGRMSSEYEFEDLAAATSKDGLSTFGTLRSSVAGYKPLTSTKIEMSADGVGEGLGGIAVAAGLWIKDMIVVFTSNSTPLEQAAVVLELVPVVGCIVRDLSEAEKGTESVGSTVECAIDSALLFTPAWPFVVIKQFIEFVVSALSGPIKEFRDLTNENTLNQRRQEHWQANARHILDGMNLDNLGKNLEGQFASEKAGITFNSAHLAGGLHTETLRSLKTDEHRKKLLSSGTYYGKLELQAATCELIRNKVAAKKEELAKLRAHINETLASQRVKFENDFFYNVEDYLIRHRDNAGFAFSSLTDRRDFELLIKEVRANYPIGPLLAPADQEALDNKLKEIESRIREPAVCEPKCTNKNMACMWTGCEGAAGPDEGMSMLLSTGMTRVWANLAGPNNAMVDELFPKMKELSDSCRAVYGSGCPRQDPTDKPDQLWCADYRVMSPMVKVCDTDELQGACNKYEAPPERCGKPPRRPADAAPAPVARR